MKLDEMVKGILDHPIASTMVISSIVNGVVRIIAVAKGKNTKPETTVDIELNK